MTILVVVACILICFQCYLFHFFFIGEISNGVPGAGKWSHGTTAIQSINGTSSDPGHCQLLSNIQNIGEYPFYNSQN